MKERISVGVRMGLAPMLALAMGPLCAPTHAQVTLRTQIPVRTLVQSQTTALKQPLRVAVQQAISALPPTAGQAFVYRPPTAADRAKGRMGTKTGAGLAPFKKEVQVGPISFRTPVAVSPRGFTARIAFSYFELAETFGPVPYVGTSPQIPGASGAIRLGVEAEASAGIFSLSGTYGFSGGWDASVNFPITLVSAKATSIFTTLNAPQFLGVPYALVFDDTDPADAVRVLDDLVAADIAVFNQANANSVGGQIDTGARLGLGRIGVAFKKEVFERDFAIISLAEEFSLPSPSSEDLAGTDSFGALTRVIAASPLGSVGRIHLDGGYEFDTEFKELWRATWNVGASLWMGEGMIDAGVGGSHYLEELDWSPATIRTSIPPSGSAEALDIDWIAQSSTGVGGTNYIDFLAGVKVCAWEGRLLGSPEKGSPERLLLGGSASVPITGDGLRPTATGTVALEYYF